MFKPSIQFSNYVSLAVMLLMLVALVAGQADASAYRGSESMTISPLATLDNRTKINFEGELSEKALQISIAIVTDLSHFRGEDE
jgi:hypothetical protein